MKTRKLGRALWIGGGVLAGLMLTAAVFQGLTAGVRPGTGDSDAEFETVQVVRSDLFETIVASGSMEPLVRVPVISEVSGIITTVNVEEGDRVERGQPLFELDRVRLEARVAELRAGYELRQANARYDLVGRAVAERDQAKRDRDRTAALMKRNVASQIELERFEHALVLAEIGINDAHAELAARRAAVAEAREKLRSAERDLENALIRAPISGVVIERSGEIGRAVADVTRFGGTVVAVIADDQRIRLVAEVDENDIARVRVGQHADVTIDAFPGETFDGSVQRISSAGKSEDNIANFEIEIRLDPDERLRVGMSSDARVFVREHHDVLLIPNVAIVREPEGPVVRRVDVAGGDSVQMRPIQTGYSDGMQTVVDEGLSSGDMILVRRAGQHG
jgi:HlyD family secretion protein